MKQNRGGHDGRHDLDRVKITILYGATRDGASPLGVLGAHKLIWTSFFDIHREWWLNEHVVADPHAFITWSKDDLIQLGSRPSVSFPPPTPGGIDVNMMPFKIFYECSLPPNLKQYWQMIRSCPISFDRIDRTNDSYLHNEKDRIAYLTVHESWVEEGRSQRRPGLHIERPYSASLPHTGGKAFALKNYTARKT